MTLEFLLLPQNLPFAVALAIVFTLALFEGLGAFIGTTLSDIVGSIFPESDFDISGPDIENTSTMSTLLAWLRIGQVPIIILLIVFLTGFAIAGLAMQIFINSLVGFLLPSILAAAIAFFAALPLTRFWGGLLHKYLPKDETYAVSINSFIGRNAVIVLGSASHGKPAQAKLKDEHGKTHYIMLEPDIEGETYNQYDALLLVRHDNNKFFAIRQST